MSCRSAISRAVQAALAGLVLLCVLMPPVHAQAPAVEPAPANGSAPSPPPVAPPVAVPPVAPAQTPPAPTAEAAGPPLVPPDLVRRLEAIVPELNRIAKAVERVRASDDELERQRAEVDALRTSGAALRQAFEPPLRAIDEQLRKLGPRPKPPAPAETAAIEAERSRLERARSEIDAAIKTLDLTDERGRQLVGHIQSYRNQLISRDILLRSPSPMLPKVWREVAGELPRAARQVWTILGGWSDLLATRPLTVAFLLLIAALIHVLTTLERARRLPRLVPEPPDPAPGSLGRITTATLAAGLVVAPAFVAVAVLVAGVKLAGLENQLVAPLLDAGLLAMTVATMTRFVAHAVLMPHHPSWRALAITSPAATRLTLLVGLIGGVLAFDIVLDALVRLLYLPPAVAIVKTHLATTAIAGLIGAMALTGLPAAPGTENAQRASVVAASWLKVPLLALAVALVVVSVLGYVGLASFVARQTLAVLTGAIVFLLVHFAIRAALAPDTLTTAPGRAGQAVTPTPATLLDTARQGYLGTVLQIILSAFAGLALIALILLSWGFSTADLASWARAAVFGFKIGDYTISLWRIMAAGLLFAGVLAATRLLQRWLARVVLIPQRMDAGIAHSIEVGTGYLGMLLAALVGLSYAGLDITNLAIVAGALSVGIGFGLQSIVNNFVSGLILLVERPIKVGDWIVVGEHQGYVRRISVRATEIETFDRASVVVPNSQLISGTVQNWTLRNAMGRLTIKVSASYSADPERVMEVLKAAVERCPSVLQYPAPRVTFSDFGASALDFTVHAFIADVAKGLDAQTELRTAIFRAFRTAGLEMPYQQTNVHLHDLDAVRALVARLADERSHRAAEDGAAREGAADDGIAGSAQPRPDASGRAG